MPDDRRNFEDVIICEVKALCLSEVAHRAGKGPEKVCGTFQLHQRRAQPNGFGQSFELIVLQAECAEVCQLIQMACMTTT